MVDSGLSAEPDSLKKEIDLPMRSELSKIDPLQNLLDLALRLEEPLKYSSEIYMKHEPLKLSHTSENLKAYDRCVEAAETYFKVSKATGAEKDERKCDICGANLDGAESHRSTSSIGKTTLLCARC